MKEGNYVRLLLNSTWVPNFEAGDLEVLKTDRNRAEIWQLEKTDERRVGNISQQ